MCGSARRDAQLDGLLDSVILPAVRHASPHVRAPAVRALGLFCLQGWPEAGSNDTVMRTCRSATTDYL
jgi:hypothetical protein